MTNEISQLDTFSRLKASVDSQTRLTDRSKTKHVRFTRDKGIYLHRGFSGYDADTRRVKRQAAGQRIWRAIAFEYSQATADAVFNQVLHRTKKNQAITLDQLNKIDAALTSFRTSASAEIKPVDELTQSEQAQRLALQAKLAIRHSDRKLYSVVTNDIQNAPVPVRNVVLRVLKNYEYGIGQRMRETLQKNLKEKGLALCSERDSIVRTRTINLLKMLDPHFKSEALCWQPDDNHDANTVAGAIRNEFNRQNVHTNVSGAIKSQGMRSSDAPKFIASRSANFQEEHEMLRGLKNEKGQPEFLMQTFFMPWQDTQGSMISHSGNAPIKEQEEGLALINELSFAAQERVEKNLPPMKVKILINDPKKLVDDRSPGKLSPDKLKAKLKDIDPRGAEVEIWGAEARQRDSHHKKMTVAVGGDFSEDSKSGVLVMTGNHDTQKILDSGVKLTGDDPALKQRKQFYAETLRSGELIATNTDGKLKEREKLTRHEMEKHLKFDPPRNDRNAGNTLMTHQPPNATLKNEFRLSEPYTLIKSGIRSAKRSIRIVMPYFQLLDLNDELKGAIARGVNVDIVLAVDKRTQEMLGHSNRESADELTAFRKALADYRGSEAVGRLNIGWFRPQFQNQENADNDDISDFNPGKSDYPHQKYFSIDNEVSILGSFNADYQSMHSAEQMVMVPSDNKARRFFQYMTSNSVPHMVAQRSQPSKLAWTKRMVRSYIGERTYPRLGLNDKASEPLPAPIVYRGNRARTLSIASVESDADSLLDNLNDLSNDSLESIDDSQHQMDE